MGATSSSELKSGIAVVGLHGRFPGAPDLERFWRNLRDGVESISRFSAEEALADGADAATVEDPDHVGAAGVLEGAELFDAELFGYSPREAERMDPQHRVFLEGAWAALDDAGYDPARFPGSIGVWAGASLNTYLLNNLFAGRPFMPSMNDLQTLIGGDKDFLATRVSYQLDLTGPSVVVQTACSTSLVAIAEACGSLLTYGCDMALAGGVSVRVPQRRGYVYEPDGIFSPDGRCRPFDAGARGTVFGNGVGIVVLKRLEDALADGDHVRAVIRGWAVNNDGSLKVGYTAPSLERQAEVVAAALAAAGVPPETIGYVEAHGTGTALGDPIEVAALARAFALEGGGRGCALGSVKANIGHLDAAAGVAAFIKAVLGLEHRELPPCANFERPSPEIDFDATPFYVPTEARPWEAGAHPRRAGVSSLGIGGTNCHVVLEEAPPRAAPAASGGWHTLRLSAASPAALDEASRALADHLERNPDVDLADVAYTLEVGRHEMGRRRAVTCDSVDAAIAALRDPGSQAPLDGSEAAAAADAAGRRWVAGTDGGEAGGSGAGVGEDDERTPHRVPLPGYPFQRRRYWVTAESAPATAHGTVGDPGAAPDERRPDLAEWLYLPSWRRADAPGDPGAATAGVRTGDPGAEAKEGPECNWIILAERPEPATVIVERLRSRGDTVELVTWSAGRDAVAAGPGPDGAAPDGAAGVPTETPSGVGTPASDGVDDVPTESPSGADASASAGVPSVTERLHRLVSGGAPPRLLYLAGGEAPVLRLLEIVQALLAAPRPAPLRLVALTRGGQEVTGDETLSPEHAAVAALCRVVTQEEPSLRCRAVDVAGSRSFGHPDQGAGGTGSVEHLIAELDADDEEAPLVALRGRHRWLPVYEPAPLPPAGPSGAPWRQGGVYWITGGFGRMGRALAESLARELGARLVLSGRTALPPRKRWNDWEAGGGQESVGEPAASSRSEPGTASAGESAPEPDSESGNGADGDAAVAARIAAVRALEALGAEVLAGTADVADRAAMEAVLERAEERFGPVDGVIHAAGLGGGLPLAEITRERATAVLRPKVDGARVLEELFDDRPLDFLVHCSSLSSVAGGLGLADYAAANAALDAAALRRSAAGRRTLAIDWDAWRGGGMAGGLLGELRPELDEQGIRSAEGAELLRRALSLGAPRVLVSTRDLATRLAEAAPRPAPDAAASSEAGAPADETAGTRTAGRGVADGAPRNDLERAVADAWQKLLGRERIGIHEDFFELGGHSLLATQLMNRLRREYRDADLTLRSLFDHPTIAGLAAVVAERRGEPLPDDTTAETDIDPDAPRNDLERAVAESWQQLLGRERIGIHEDFFELGGHSLLATQLMNRLRREYRDADLTLRSLFDHPTIAGLAAVIAERRRESDGAVSREPVPGGKPDDEPGDAVPELPPVRDRLLAAPASARVELAEVYMRRSVAAALGIPEEGLAGDDALDGEQAPAIVAHLVQALARDFELRVYPPEIRRRLSITALARFLVEEVERLESLTAPRGEAAGDTAREAPAEPAADAAEEVEAGPGVTVAPSTRQEPRTDSLRQPNDRAAFLLSAPRSGSTLLRLMLSAHPGLFCPPELTLLGFDTLAGWAADGHADLHREGLLRTWTALTETTPESAGPRLDEWIREGLPVREVYRRLQELAAPRLLVDKTPIYAYRTETLRRAEELFDRPLYLHLARHPLAVIDSFVRSRFDRLRGEPGDPYEVAERYWRRSNRNLLELGERLEGERYLLVRFEDVVREPGRVLPEVAGFLGVPFDEAMLRPYEEGRMFGGPGDPNAFARGEIDPGRAEVWKSVELPRPLSPESRRLAVELGYELESAGSVA